MNLFDDVILGLNPTVNKSSQEVKTRVQHRELQRLLLRTTYDLSVTRNKMLDLGFRIGMYFSLETRIELFRAGSSSVISFDIPTWLKLRDNIHLMMVYLQDINVEMKPIKINEVVIIFGRHFAEKAVIIIQEKSGVQVEINNHSYPTIVLEKEMIDKLAFAANSITLRAKQLLALGMVAMPLFEPTLHFLFTQTSRLYGGSMSIEQLRKDIGRYHTIWRHRLSTDLLKNTSSTMKQNLLIFDDMVWLFTELLSFYDKELSKYIHEKFDKD